MQFYAANCLPGSAPSLEDAPVTWKHSVSVCVTIYHSEYLKSH